MKNKLLGLGIFVLAFVFIIGGVSSKKVLAAGAITSSVYDKTTGDLVLTGSGFDTLSTIDVTTLTITGVGAGTTTLTIATANPTPISATSARVVIAGANKTAVDALLDTIGIVASDAVPYNLSAAVNWQGTNLADLTTPITVGASPVAVNLLTLSSGNFAVFSNTAISSTGTTSISGDIGVGPGVTSTAITGNFALTAPPTTYTTSALVTGKVYAYDYDVPTPAKVNQASLDLTTAYNAALVPATTVLDAGASNLAGLTLAPGVYTFDGPGNVLVTNDVTLSGGPNSVWIFQIPGTLNISSAKSVLLSGGAVPANIFWAVAGTTTLQTTSAFKGNILAGPGASTIAMQNGATLNGRALGQTAVTLIANTVTSPNAPVASSDADLSNLAISFGTLSPVFSSGTLSYTASVSHSVSSVTVTPTASEAHATITVNGTIVASGVASASIPLSAGNNTITIETTAQDTTTLSYVITISRASATSSGSYSGGGSHIIPTPILTTEPAEGCSNGNLFNTSTGHACVNNEKLEIPGCSNRTIGFSTATGDSCVGNHVTTITTNIPATVIYNFSTLTLKNGSSGEAVMELQRFLNSNLNLSLLVDGVFGAHTEFFVKKWQANHGLTSDGHVGPKTKEMMNR